MRTMTVEDRFEEIMDQIKTLAKEARTIVKEHGSTHDLARADAYWYPQIIGTVDGTASMGPMSDFIKHNDGEEFLYTEVDFENPLDEWEDDEDEY